MSNSSAPGKPDNGLVGAILSTLFCCLPFGIAAIVFAAQVDTAWNAGNHTAAHESAEKAKNWTIASVVTGLVVIVGYLCVALN